MGSKQKYIQDEFEMDEFFIKQIHDFRNGAALQVAAKIDKMIGIESTSGRIKNIAGHVYDRNKRPVYFMVDYFKENDESPIVLVDINRIDTDRYLDSINLNQYIK